MNETECFDDWIEVKKELHRSNRIQAMKEGEIWWCAVGENVGVEINGKSSTFARPMLIFRKLSRFGFLGIPLTSGTLALDSRGEIKWLCYLKFASLAYLGYTRKWGT